MEINFIPIEFYDAIFYNLMLLCVVVIVFHSVLYGLTDRYTIDYTNIFGVIILITLVVFMGFRPVHPNFVDMVTYAKMFRLHQYGLYDFSASSKDLTFQLFIKFCSQIMGVNTFFFICALLYVMPLYIVSRKWFREYWFFSFFMLIISFSFWAYGTNGIRNGIASSLALLAFSRDKKLWQISLLVLAVAFHKSILLPALAFTLTWFNNDTKKYLILWTSAIPLSLLFSEFWLDIFVGLIEDERDAYFTTKPDEMKFSSTGFRWDFLVYSAIGVFAGGYYLFKKKLEDHLYVQLFNVYLFANAFWILVIRANFSNRFAYLSWFLLGVIIIYPWLKFYFQKQQHKNIAWIIALYFSFTYLMNVVLN